MSLPKMIWSCVNYRDAVVAIEFLKAAFGFEVSALYREGDHVAHAELLLPGSGGIMLGSAAETGTPFERLPAGSSGLYVATDDPAGVFERARAAGARVVQEPKPGPDGQTTFTVADPEGNLWSFGSYRGESGSGR